MKILRLHDKIHKQKIIIFTASQLRITSDRRSVLHIQRVLFALQPHRNVRNFSRKTTHQGRSHLCALHVRHCWSDHSANFLHLYLGTFMRVQGSVWSKNFTQTWKDFLKEFFWKIFWKKNLTFNDFISVNFLFFFWNTDVVLGCGKEQKSFFTFLESTKYFWIWCYILYFLFVEIPYFLQLTLSIWAPLHRGIEK